MDAFTNIFLSQSTQDEDQPKYKGNVYKKCNQCNKRRKPLDKSHKICRVCYKLNLLTRSSGNQVIDDFIRSTQINGLEADMMEFVPYDRFKDIEFVEKVRAYKATWIDGNVQGWNEEEINFKRSGPKKVVLKRFEDSENITSVDLNRLKNVHDNDLKTEPDIFGSCENHCYGITQDPITKDFVMIMESYMLDDLKHHIANHLISQSGNKVVDDFIRNAQIHSGLKISMMMEFVPYDQFEDVKFIAKVESGGIYKATWIDGNIQGWNNEEIKFERSGLRKVILKKLDDSENITSTELIKLKISLNGNLKTEYGIFGSYVNNCYGITQDSDTKDFMIIMDNYMLDDLKHITDQLLYKSGNKVVDDFIRNTQTGLKVDMMEFVPYDRFKDVEIIAKVDYKATWIDGNIQGWNEEEIDFKRSGLRKVILKKLDDSEDITLEELDEKIKIFYNCNSETGHNIFGSYVTNCYGITQDPNTKDFMIIMNNFILDDLKSFIATDHLLHQSGNKVVDEFIKHTQVHSNLEIDMMEFVPYDRFKDIKFVAEGGFSKIYKATWIDGNIQGWNEKEIDFKRTGPRVVALKKLDNSENITSKELNELKIFYDCNLRTKQKQDQPDIGMFVNKWYGITQDHVTKDFMVIMEFYESDLRHYLTNEFYKIDWYIKLVKLVDIVEGLDRIHNAKIIHRDLHSGNILMDIIVLIICDLGLNKSSLVSTDEKEIYGVIPYVAPEIFQGKEYTMASDMYSFGMIMWEFMTYRRPFWDRDHDTELIIGICDGLRPSIVTNAPEGYTKIMQECWDPDPDKRPKPADINKRLYEIINVERKNPTKIAKSPDIGPITTNNPGAIYTSRLLSEMIKSAMTIRSLKSQSITSGSDKRNFEDDLTEINKSIKRNRLSENEINSKTEGNS